jgi:hypothetical protein
LVRLRLVRGRIKGDRLADLLPDASVLADRHGSIKCANGAASLLDFVPTAQNRRQSPKASQREVNMGWMVTLF